MSLFTSINKTADAPQVDVYAEEIERERARRAAKYADGTTEETNRIAVAPLNCNLED